MIIQIKYFFIISPLFDQYSDLHIVNTKKKFLLISQWHILIPGVQTYIQQNKMKQVYIKMLAAGRYCINALSNAKKNMMPLKQKADYISHCIFYSRNAFSCRQTSRGSSSCCASKLAVRTANVMDDFDNVVLLNLVD